MLCFSTLCSCESLFSFFFVLFVVFSFSFLLTPFSKCSFSFSQMARFCRAVDLSTKPEREMVIILLGVV